MTEKQRKYEKERNFIQKFFISTLTALFCYARRGGKVPILRHPPTPPPRYLQNTALFKAVYHEKRGQQYPFPGRITPHYKLKRSSDYVPHHKICQTVYIINVCISYVLLLVYSSFKTPLLVATPQDNGLFIA